jgi:hypothetical protein
MKLKLIFAIILAVPTLTTCQKAREKRWCKNPIKIPQRVVDYFYFKEGTYWVYENETTHELDSQWVCYSKFDTISPDDNLNKQCNCTGKHCYQKIDMSISSKKNNGCKSEKAYLNYLINFDANQVSKFTKDFYVFNMMFSGANRTTGFSYKFDNNDNWLGLSTIKDSINFNINNLIFTEGIYQIDLSKLPTGQIYANDIYQECLLARNIGYIRFKALDNNYWSLIRKKIVK